MARAVLPKLRLEVFVADLHRFAGFYVGVLRFELADDRRREPTPYVAVRRGHVRIGAALAWETVDRRRRAVPHGVELVIEVPDLAAERDAIVDAGWELDSDIRHQPWGLADFRLFDPDGHYLRFTSVG